MMDHDLQTAYDELRKSFSLLPTEDKRKVISEKINEMSQAINSIDPIDDIVDTNAGYTSEDEYFCYLHDIIYNLENKLGNIFKSIS